MLRLNLVLTHGIPPEFRGGVHLFKPPSGIGSAPSLLSHAIAYRWRSLPRVRRHRANKPQGSSERVLPWQVTLDESTCASFSHTLYWHEVVMLKIPKYSYTPRELHKQHARSFYQWRTQPTKLMNLPKDQSHFFSFCSAAFCHKSRF